MKIAVLGMGRMGQALAGRLLESGHDLVVWNRSPERSAEMVARGARQASRVADAVAGVDLAMTSLAHDDAVRHVAFGEGGIKASLTGDACFVEVSTISPALSNVLDREFSRFAVMPILGNPVAVASGQATYLFGGKSDVAAVVDRLFPALSPNVRHYDSPPLASTAKLAVNLLLLDGLVALAESVALGRAGGLTDDQLRQLLGDSPMVAPGLKNRFEGLLTAHQAPWWTTGLGAKDAGLAVDAVASSGGELPLTGTARDLYLKVASLGWADADIAAVIHLYRG